MIKGSENIKNIENDTMRAKENGISYGMYKAGIFPDDSFSGYAVRTSEFLRKTEEKDTQKKTLAFIK